MKKFNAYVLIWLILSVPLATIAIFTLWSGYKGMNELTLARRQAVAGSAAQALHERLEKIVSLGRQFIIHPKFREAIISEDWQSAIGVVEVMLANYQEVYIDRAFLTDPDGTLVAEFPGLATTVGKNFSHRDWYRGVISAGKPYVSEVYTRAADPQYNVVAVSFPISNDEQFLAGILVLQIKLDHFFDWLNDLDLGQSGFVYVVDQAGNIVAHPNISPQGEIVNYYSDPAVQKLLGGESGIGTFFNPAENVKVLEAFQPVSEYSWGIVVREDIEDAFAFRDRTIRTAALIVLFGLIYNIVLSVLFLRLKSKQNLKD